jgi:hypothetical protein
MFRVGMNVYSKVKFMLLDEDGNNELILLKDKVPV